MPENDLKLPSRSYWDGFKARNSAMWDKIDTEIASAISASKFRNVETYTSGQSTGNKRGKK
jgi:hypothetical protein